MKWFKIWGQDIFSGSTFKELDEIDRGIWFSLLVIASISPDEGFIYKRKDEGYSVEILANLLNVDIDNLKNSLVKLSSADIDKIEIDSNNIIKIVNFEIFNDNYTKYRKFKYHNKVKKKKVVKQTLNVSKTLVKQTYNIEVEQNKNRIEIEKNTAIKPKKIEVIKVVDEPYKLENLRNEQKLVLTFKVIKGYNLEDRKWDTLNFARNLKPALKLLEFFDNNMNLCMNCMDDLSKRFNKAGLTWGFEAVVNNASDWYNEIKNRRKGEINE